MSLLLFAITQWSMTDLAIFFVVLAIIIGIVVIVVRQAGIQIPQWVWQIAGLVILAVVAILAIRFVASL